MIAQNLLLTLHNTHSPKTVKSFAETVTSFPALCKNIIFSKISSSAASMGIPDAQKIVLGSGSEGNLLFFSDISDIIETLKPEMIYLLVSKRYGKNPVDFQQIFQEITAKKTLVIVGGARPGLTRKELDLGDSIFINETPALINPVALTAIFLYGLTQSGSDNL
jgi:SpoU rRNA methylase family enzyme